LPTPECRLVDAHCAARPPTANAVLARLSVCADSGAQPRYGAAAAEGRRQPRRGRGAQAAGAAANAATGVFRFCATLPAEPPRCRQMPRASAAADAAVLLLAFDRPLPPRFFRAMSFFARQRGSRC